MRIRTFIPGDEVAQVGIYNEAAAELPKFKPTTIDEVRRRLRGPDFDPGLRFFAVANDRAVGYMTCQANGRLSFPWCRRGHEALAEPLFAQALETLKQRGVTKGFAAYRGDWARQREFFEAHGFRQAREMVNFVMDFAEMPTPGAPSATNISALSAADLGALPALGHGVFRTLDADALSKHYLENPYFHPEAVFVLRSRSTDAPMGLGLVVAKPAYMDPYQVDSAMPCYRLGAIGTEGLTTKRINGLFSFVAPDSRDFGTIAMELLLHATRVLADTEVSTLAAQVPSDAPHLLRFYKQYFRRQGSFPVYEREL